MKFHRLTTDRTAARLREFKSAPHSTTVPSLAAIVLPVKRVIRPLCILYFYYLLAKDDRVPGEVRFRDNAAEDALAPPRSPRPRSPPLLQVQIHITTLRTVLWTSFELERSILGLERSFWGTKNFPMSSAPFPLPLLPGACSKICI